MITVLQIAGSLLGEIDWHPQDGFGYCRCPGADLHQNRSGKRDTRVYLAGVPTITCLHSSCAGVVAAKNRELRSTVSKLECGSNPGVRRFVKTPEQLTREGEKMVAAQLAAQAKDALPKILKAYRWTVADIWHDSPDGLDAVEDDWRRLLSLFAPEEVVWIGGRYDSGQPGHSAHFRTAAEWLSGSTCPQGPHVSPFAYAQGVCSRKAINVLRRVFLVVEGDSLPKDEQGAILRWLRDAAGLRLRAVIDTMERSIHGWYDVPEPAAFKELESVLPALGCDPALLRPTQVSRLPSCWRGKKMQGLLYLDAGNGGAQ